MGLDSLKFYIIGVIFFVVVITSGVMIIGTFYTADNSLDNSNQITYFNNTLNKAGDVTNAVSSIDNSVSSVTSNVGVLGWLNALVGSAYNGLRAITTSFGFINIAANDAGSMLGIPTTLITLILLIITVIVIFGIWSVITRTY